MWGHVGKKGGMKEAIPRGVLINGTGEKVFSKWGGKG